MLNKGDVECHGTSRYLEGVGVMRPPCVWDVMGHSYMEDVECHGTSRYLEGVGVMRPPCVWDVIGHSYMEDVECHGTSMYVEIILCYGTFVYAS